MTDDEIAYAPFYCEENAWHLCVRPELGTGARKVVFVSNRGRHVALWCQRAAGRRDAPVIWDYHVVVMVEGPDRTAVWDLDCTLGLDIDLDEYLHRTFVPVPDDLAPVFRIVDADEYRAEFASDRSHMIDVDARYRQPPPPWPPIGSGHNLPRFIDVQAPFVGSVEDLATLRRRIGSR